MYQDGYIWSDVGTYIGAVCLRLPHIGVRQHLPPRISPSGVHQYLPLHVRQSPSGEAPLGCRHMDIHCTTRTVPISDYIINCMWSIKKLDLSLTERDLEKKYLCICMKNRENSRGYYRACYTGTPFGILRLIPALRGSHMEM